MSLRSQAAGASRKTRTTGGTDQVTVKSTPGVLHRLLVSNPEITAQTVTVVDGSTTLLVARVPAGTTVSMDMGMRLATSLKLTPGHANLDILSIYE